MTKEVSLIEYLKLKLKKLLEHNTPIMKAKYTDLPGSSHTYRSNNVTQNIISNGEEVFMVNGKQLKPGTPEYIQAKKQFDSGMASFHSGMAEFQKSMQKMGEDLGNMFK